MCILYTYYLAGERSRIWPYVSCNDRMNLENISVHDIRLDAERKAPGVLRFLAGPCSESEGVG